MYRTLIWHADQYNYKVRFACTSQLLYLWCCDPQSEIPWTYQLRISPKWHRSKIKTPVSSETTLLTPWLTTFSVHSKCLITIFWFFVRGAYIWSKYYIIMATFCWHIIITSDYKLMCRCVQVMEHCILFNVGPYLMMALISLYLIFTNREDHILSRKKCIANQFVDRIILHFH